MSLPNHKTICCAILQRAALELVRVVQYNAKHLMAPYTILTPPLTGKRPGPRSNSEGL